MIDLQYGTVTTRISCEDQFLLDEALDQLKIENPCFDPTVEGSEPEIVFFDEETRSILTGHIPIIRAWAKKKGIRCNLEGVPDTSPAPDVNKDIVPGIILHDYQVTVLRKSLEAQRGVIEVATGGGKTEIAIAIILALKKPKTLFVCPDTASMKEMYKRFKTRGISGRLVGRLGAGYHETKKRIVVAVINSVYSGLKRNKPDIVKFCEDAELLFIDEVHHQATANSWKIVGASCYAKYRYGMSGTPYKDNKSRFNAEYLHPDDSWLTGYLGPTIIHLSPQDLQKNKQLAPCHIFQFAGGGHRFGGHDWTTVYRKGIVYNKVRNTRIVNLLVNLVDIYAYPLVSVKQLKHGKLLQTMLKKYHDIEAICSYGGTTYIASREFADEYCPGWWKDQEDDGEAFVRIPSDFALLDAFKSRKFSVLIGSQIYDEALDIPFLTDLINAAGGKAPQRLRQKVGRVLRLSDSKGTARVWEPWDTCHVYLNAHSKRRINTLREEGFEIVGDWAPFYKSTFRSSQIRRSMIMKMKHIKVEVSMTINLGNFECIKPSVSLEAEMEKGDTPDKVFEELSTHCTALWFREAWSQSYQLGQIKNSSIPEQAERFLESIAPRKD